MPQQAATIQARALELTRRLVACGSFSRTRGERDLAGLLEVLLEELGGDVLEHGLEPLGQDPLGRSFVWAFLPGSSGRTVVLISHFDTVDTEDYGSLAPVALDPDALRLRLKETDHLPDGLTRAHLDQPDEWLLGRGSVDMKSGIAAELVVLEELCRRARTGDRLPGSVLFISAPDEESESAGILAAVEFLDRLRGERGLEYLGGINTDYTSPRYEGDEERAVYLGTTGKLLPSVYVRGVETHAGEPYVGVDANLLLAEVITQISMDSELADIAHGEVAAAPVSLKVSDFKDTYDVRVPFDGYAYFNYLTVSLTPEDVLERVQSRVSRALASALTHTSSHARRWGELSGRSSSPTEDATVLTYVQLHEAASQALGTPELTYRLDSLNDRLAAEGTDARLRAARMVRELWNLSGLLGPAAVVYFSPPYYPHALSDPTSPFIRAVERVSRARGLRVRRYYPYISDGSYLSLRGAGDISVLQANMPLWTDEPSPTRYHLPFAAMERLGLDIVNMGVWGYGAHKREERVHIPYSCGLLPGIILEVIATALGEPRE